MLVGSQFLVWRVSNVPASIVNFPLFIEDWNAWIFKYQKITKNESPMNKMVCQFSNSTKFSLELLKFSETGKASIAWTCNVTESQTQSQWIINENKSSILWLGQKKINSILINSHNSSISIKILIHYVYINQNKLYYIHTNFKIWVQNLNWFE